MIAHIICRCVVCRASEYEFAEVATAVHEFWLESLCDRYLEMIKRVVYSTEAKEGKGKAVKERSSALAVLYFCLEYGLKLMHPMMPFVTEELYHRLPVRRTSESKSGSIMVERYPQSADVAHWVSDEVEADFKVLDDIAHSSRSSRAALGLTNRRVDLFAVTSSDKVNMALREERSYRSLIG